MDPHPPDYPPPTYAKAMREKSKTAECACCLKTFDSYDLIMHSGVAYTGASCVVDLKGIPLCNTCSKKGVYKKKEQPKVRIPEYDQWNPLPSQPYQDSEKIVRFVPGVPTAYW